MGRVIAEFNHAQRPKVAQFVYLGTAEWEEFLRARYHDPAMRQLADPKLFMGAAMLHVLTETHLAVS